MLSYPINPNANAAECMKGCTDHLVEALKAEIPEENCWQNWKHFGRPVKSRVPGKNSKYTQSSFNTLAIKSSEASDVMSGDRGHKESHTHIYTHTLSSSIGSVLYDTLRCVYEAETASSSRVMGYTVDVVYGSAHPLLLHPLWLWHVRVTYSHTHTNRDTSDNVGQNRRQIIYDNHLWLSRMEEDKK